ncbi:MAG TPA: O-antigen ligase family protein [Blastocatellia bacterium]|jgi:O-antigen ligase
MIGQYGSVTKPDVLSRAVAAGMLAAIVFTALAHGAVEPWSVAVFEVIVLALALLWAIKIMADRRIKVTVPRTALPMAAFIAIGLIQSVAITGADGYRRSLSFNVESTRGAVIVLVLLTFSFLTAANFFTGRKRLFTIASFLTVYGMVVAVFALAQYFTWNGHFYWLRPNTVSTSPFGPFVNHNHFAGYMEMLIPIPLALVITRAVRGGRRLLYALAAALMALAAVVSLSRGGMISLLASFIFIFVMSRRLSRTLAPAGRSRANRAGADNRPRLRSPGGRAGSAKPSLSPSFLSRAVTVCLIAGVIAAGGFWIGAEPIIDRITQGEVSSTASQRETFYASRGWIWKDTLTMISANPILGVGLGAYGTAFSIYTKSDGAIRVPQAHNDYLQIVADCGVIGGALALWFIVSLFRAILRPIRSLDPLVSGLALGGSASIFAILVHSFFDFNLQLPSNALLFLFLSAIASQAGAAALDTEASPPSQGGRGMGDVDLENFSAANLARGAS